ncbi:MAG: hypothetical protein GY822_03905 [Deltaproteobacteria bacterium]|nr:hypothetical protein [Deltaproteobacteria bacterium]
MSNPEKEVQATLMTAFAAIAAKTATENLNPSQVKELKAQAEEEAINGLLAVRDASHENQAKERKIDELPFVVRTLVRQVQAWSQVGAGISNSKD